MNARSPADRRWLQRLVPIVITSAVVLAAAWAALRLWDHYELAPWTRDGRVRANVVQIAPDVSGLVTVVPIHDNESVKAGTLLFEVDPARYQLAVRQAEVALAAQRTTLAQAQREDGRNAGLGTLISQEVREQARMRVEQARAAVAQAEVSLDSARLNLARASVRAPTDGLVTNLDMRQGSYATSGRPVLALVDAASFYVEGYFEETKLPRIHTGDRVSVTTMGEGAPLAGTVESFAAGIADRDRSTSANLLPSVNPTFNWVRLAQRVPVRVKLDPLPGGMHLVAGQTVTVQVIEEGRGGDASSAALASPAKKG
ncbi:HlyD family secretion protein [Variovorax sp. J2P1-59]|uniref:efflux RND transporter periplasmic adaptor subunit n=1 Tax=Variovorax flavidus TaxID=3053501 RepID=UPI002577E766|nr:HlyD family secretion protein [Variovorax sp. J2P1-59]MDM0073391.1 HlyD family secretion protein [Variovorax sp. J2P1-59]